MKITEEVRVLVPKDKEGLMYFGEIVKKYYLQDTDFRIKDSSKYIILEFARETEVEI